MMNWRTFIMAGLVAMIALQGVSFAKEGPNSFRIANRLRLEYDDNINQTKTDKKDSFKIIEEIELMGDLNMQQTFLSLHYRPKFMWWSDRDDDDTDWHHDIDFIFNHRFTPRLSLGIKDTFRRAEQPELSDGEMTVRGNSDFNYNSANASVSAYLRPDMRLDVDGRYVLLRYDDDAPAQAGDYDLYVGGLSLRHQFVPETAAFLDLRYESIDYRKSILNRNSATYSGGLGVDHTFSPSLLGSARAGIQYKDFSDTYGGDDTAPYGELSATYLPSPATRITLGASYTLLETDVDPYANQQRLRAYLSLAYDITARISWYLSGSYAHGEYSSDDLPEGTIGGIPIKDIYKDGGEDTIQASTRVTFQLNRYNWLEAGYQFTDLDSDLRENFNRSRINVGWKISL